MKKYYYTPIISHHEIRLNTTIMSGENPDVNGGMGGGPGENPGLGGGGNAPGRILYI